MDIIDMNDDKKMAFLLTAMKHGLDHVASTPNEVGADGKMSHDKKLAFVEKVAKHGLEHFAIGGVGGAVLGQNNYNAGLAPTQTSNYGDTINQAGTQALSGYSTAQNLQGQQQGLANQLQAETQGAGPNPAQAALNQSTGQNVANQAALMAGQRGASTNAGLIARQDAQQGASTQQQAVGQSATLQAQQQLAAQQQLQAQQAAQQSANVAEQNSNNQLFGGAASAQNAQNANSIANTLGAEGINAAISQNNTNNLATSIGGLINSGAGAAAALFAKGGIAGPHLRSVADIFHGHKYADGGSIYSGPTTANIMKENIPSANGSILDKVTSSAMPGKSSTPMTDNGFTMPEMGSQFSQNPSEATGTPTSNGLPFGGLTGSGVASNFGGLGGAGVLAEKAGGRIPGKSKYKGDNTKNDVVPALLSKGELVIDNETMNDPGMMGKMARALAAHIEAKNKGKKS